MKNTENVMPSGSFTIPGEAGYENLTLAMAKKWGADVVRDSDGTKLSDEILQAGYKCYSTICVIRDHNEWAKQHPNQLQQTFLMTSPVVATGKTVAIELLKDFFSEQFKINDTKESLKYWQVYDRTIDEEVKGFSYDTKKQQVTVTSAIPWHSYTVSFLAFRIWEEISMYNHTTNHWEKEHLMQIDPMHAKTRDYLTSWLEQWCIENPKTDVVRFTSMFYNFVWIWGSNERNRYLYSDWASYDFTVSPLALDNFEKEYGYRLTAEDFINQGKLQVTHMPATDAKRDWMEFINQFVVLFGKELVDIVHKYGKQAYVFYDDSWVGVEPYHRRFTEFGFDGLIKCVFSGYEVRLCAGVKVPVHEIRLHPYLFPTGLGGAQTFMEGGNPTLDAKQYWKNVRRALLQQPVDRIGLGGYLHLVEGFPDFVDYMEQVANEFRTIKSYHAQGSPKKLGIRIAVLHYWGSLRSWSLSGHFHETYMHDLIHINESLSGLPVDAKFINFDDIRHGCLKEYDVVINAGRMGNAWSGGDAWNDEQVIEKLTEWTYEGGVFIGVNEPSATKGYNTTFRMAHVLGVDYDLGERVCHGKWAFSIEEEPGLLPQGSYIKKKENVYLTNESVKVYMQQDGIPTLSINSFGKGKGIYLASFEHCLANTRMLLNLLLFGVNKPLANELVTDDARSECVYYDKSNTLVIYNNSAECCEPAVTIEGVTYKAKLNAYESETFKVNKLDSGGNENGKVICGYES